MSRRKQSNPKPLKREDEEEWGSEAEGDAGAAPAASPAASSADTSSAPAAASPEEPSSEVPPPPTIKTSPPPSPVQGAGEGSPPPPPPPRLRLKAGLATDPALRAAPSPVLAPAPPAPAVPVPPTAPATAPGLEYLASLNPAFHTALPTSQFFCLPPEGAGTVPQSRLKPDSLESTRQVPVYMCNPCGIRYSSLSTLEAHQTYYCSHRTGGAGAPNATNNTAATVAATNKTASQKGRGDSDSEDGKLTTGGEEADGDGGAKSQRTGKQYACPHCSYSADKKVSLNRHMRMHSTSPPAPTTTVNGATVATPIQTSSSGDALHLVDRYCQDCDIRFSSVKTFRAHKMHYCSTRHVVKPPSVNKPPGGSGESVAGSPPPASTSPSTPPPPPRRGTPPAPFLALPTNPILLVPYALFQGASLLTGSAAMGLPAPDTACLLLPNGTIQPMAQAVHAPVPPPPPPQPPKEELRTSGDQARSSEQVKMSTSSRTTPSAASSSSSSSSSSSRAPQTSREDTGSGAAPLDLSVRRSSGSELVVDLDNEHDNVDVGEDIVCAPSIPAMLMSASPSPSPPASPASSSNRRGTGSSPPSKRLRTESSGGSNSPSPKASSPRSPRRLSTPNGVITNTNQQQRKVLAAALSQTLQGQDNNLSSLLLAAVAATQGDGNGAPLLKSPPVPLPYPSPITAAGKQVLPNKSQSAKASPIAPLIPPSLLLPSPRGGAPNPEHLLSPAALLPLLTSEMALRMATEAAAVAAAPPPPPPPPQVLVKQGVSKCRECNIVFCKHENYMAHKKHYCSARLEGTVVEESGTGMTSPGQAVPSSPSTSNCGSPPNSIPGSKERASPTSPGVQKQPTLLQFICAACGIKFTSFDNLTAHQAYYCPKRAEVIAKTDLDKPGVVAPRKCVKCKLTLDPLIPHQCTAGGSSGGSSGGWKCPCCDVVSPTANAAQRHMDTHSGVKAFRCTICRYKGNTLRGMRTHIRMHFEKKSADLQEENFISCIINEEATVNPPQPLSLPPDTGPLPMEIPSLAEGGEGGRTEKLHFCELCNYSSTYKGNVVRHQKLVHGKSEEGSSSPMSMAVSPQDSRGEREGTPESVIKQESIIKQEAPEQVPVKEEGSSQAFHEEEEEYVEVEEDPQTTTPIKDEPVMVSGEAEDIAVGDGHLEGSRTQDSDVGGQFYGSEHGGADEGTGQDLPAGAANNNGAKKSGSKYLCHNPEETSHIH